MDRNCIAADWRTHDRNTEDPAKQAEKELKGMRDRYVILRKVVSP